MSETNVPQDGGGAGGQGEGQKPPQPPGGDDAQTGSLGTQVQQFNRNPPVAARVPERGARGVHATGVLVLDSPTEFVIDFLQGLIRPYQVVARIVVHPVVMGQMQAAMKENVDKYVATFGSPPQNPQPPQRRPTIQEIYETFKLPDELMSGNYANSVMIGHSQAEFYMDFITGFYPHAGVSSRIFLASSQAPRVLETLTIALQQYHKRYPPQGQGPAQGPAQGT